MPFEILHFRDRMKSLKRKTWKGISTQPCHTLMTPFMDQFIGVSCCVRHLMKWIGVKMAMGN